LVLQAIARWLHFAGYALGFGVLAFQSWLIPEERPGIEEHIAVYDGL